MMGCMSTDIEPTPEGLLLESARKNHNPSMNIRARAAEAPDLTEILQSRFAGSA